MFDAALNKYVFFGIDHESHSKWNFSIQNPSCMFETREDCIDFLKTKFLKNLQMIPSSFDNVFLCDNNGGIYIHDNKLSNDKESFFIEKNIDVQEDHIVVYLELYSKSFLQKTKTIIGPDGLEYSRIESFPNENTIKLDDTCEIIFFIYEQEIEIHKPEE